jgi:NhaA family Na+:H+ antiporter
MAKESPLPDLPSEPVGRFTAPIVRFMHVEAAGGVVLLLATLVSLAMANSPAADGFLAFWKTKVGFSFGGFSMEHSLKHWINDGLMAIFFFVIGLEVKRELVLGELRDLRAATLPIAAAIGGMIVPAGLYLALQGGQPGAPGWGIPMATDIAFVVGCMAVLGNRVPKSLRILLLSLAIVDDIGAILVIAIGYTDALSIAWLIRGFAGILVVLFLGRIGVRNIGVYTVIGTFIWLAFHESGVHATIAGVILGLITPARSWVDRSLVTDVVERARAVMGGEGWDESRYALMKGVEKASREAMSPLERLEHGLHPWVSFLIMPLFALANAGVPLKADAVAHPVALAIILGLFIGKPLGVVLFSWIATRMKIARKPAEISWGALAGGGFLAGIGFTMALFIAELALTDELLYNAKMGILTASAAAAVVGMVTLFRLLPSAAAGESAG